MHDLMARAVTPADFRKAVLRLPLPPEEHQALTDHFLAVLEQSPILQYCFTPEEGKVILREESLYIPQEKKHLRPDRVVIKEGKAVILDFKFGQKKESFHLRQVRQYMQHYEAMGLATEGYLWYWQSEQPLVPVERK